MTERSLNKKKSSSPDWLVQGVLTKIGEAFDRITGRGWKPSSSLATSELSERLKALVDAEVRVTPERSIYVPHIIKLKMQWDKFSTDSESALKKLETELLTALIDHINDKRYYTYAPISLEVKPDYFTNGVKLFASFESGSDDEREASVNVTVPDLKVELPKDVSPKGYRMEAIARFAAAGKSVETLLKLDSGKRISVGRTKENDLAIDDVSVSKMHASLLLNSDGDLIVADTGSTNGTFINGERIAYGKANVFSADDEIKFGTVEVKLDVIEKTEVSPSIEPVELPDPAKFRVGEFEFTQKVSPPEPTAAPAETLPSIPVPRIGILKPLAAEPAATVPFIKLENEGTESSKEE